jgi:hypothetical protein
MSKTDKYQTILNWLEKEKMKDKIQLEKSKLDIVNQIKGLNKEQMFIKQESKLTLWQRIKKTIWGL